MAILKLHIDQDDAFDFQLLAIHTALEDFRLAYFLNRQLQLGLRKEVDQIKPANKQTQAFFSRFTFDDIKNDVLWTLIENENEIPVKTNAAQDLFLGSKASFGAKGFLLPEFKKVNFFLKIDDTAQHINTIEIANKVKRIDWVSTAYYINLDTVKSKNNLIF